MWKIPLSDIDFSQEEAEALRQVLDSGWLSMGQVTAAFEAAMRDFLGVRHAFAVASGTAALHLANAALGLEAGDEVILPALTFVAAANSIVYTGATPVFAEISSQNDLTISVDDLAKRITPQTRAVMVMHYGGYLCDMPAIMRVARQHGLAVVEDAAHAPGAGDGGVLAGCWGDVGCFSFFANKNLVTGEGGLVVTNRDDLAERIRLMRSHGMTSLTWDRHTGHSSSYDVINLGYNYRMDELRAALGLVQLRKLERNNQRRRELSAAYRQGLDGLSTVSIPFSKPRGASAAHLMAVILKDPLQRQRVISSLRNAGIQTSLHYPPIHLFQYYRQNYHSKPGDLPLTEDIASRLVTLPLYPTLSLTQVEQVCSAIRSCLAEA